MYSRLVIDRNAVYEIDEECVQKRKTEVIRQEREAEKSEKKKRSFSKMKTGAHKRPVVF